MNMHLPGKLRPILDTLLATGVDTDPMGFRSMKIKRRPFRRARAPA